MSSPTASSRAGSHRETSSSLSALVSTLVPCLALAAVLVGAFLLLRNKQRRLYAPRTYHDVLSEYEKTPYAGNGLMGWMKNFRHLSDDYILNHHSLDAYLYIRFLKTLVLMSFVGAIITWPVLFPINATGGNGESGLEVLAFGNVDNATRYFAHAVIAWIFFGWVMFLIAREMLYLVKVRQAYLLSTWNASRISQRTVLFTNVPKQYLSIDTLSGIFRDVSRIWLVPDIDKLQDNVDDLDKAALKLEKAEIKLIQNVNKAHQKNTGQNNAANGRRTEHDSWENIIKPDMRPTQKSKLLKGKKVDAIDYNREQMMSLLPQIRKAQHDHLSGKQDLISAVFIEFSTLAAAQTAQVLTVHHTPASFVARQMGVLPDEIIWKNLGMKSWDRSARRAIATVAIAALILFWSFPVALVGIISNVNYLTDNVPFLAWIDDIPSVILGVVTGLLPAILLAVLMALVPIICRVVAKLAGAVTLSEVEQQTQTWYFAFQVIQVFLVTTFTSGATAVASQIVSQPSQAIPLLSRNLPKASNFYISFFILYGVAMASRYLINIMGLVGVLVLSKLAKTPRKKYIHYVQLAEPSWGSEYPRWTNLGVIAISYGVIAPLVLGFATVGLGLIYLAYRYNMLYAHSSRIDTKGACYARALQQLMVGVYLAELCLLGLFGIGIGKQISAVGPVIMQVLLIIATLAFHISMRKKLKPLVDVLPLDLLNASESKRSDVDRAEKGNATLSMGDDFHPGYDRHKEQQANAVNGTKTIPNGQPQQHAGPGIVSPGISRANRHHTHAASNDLGHNSSSPGKQSLLRRIFARQTQSAVAIAASLVPRFRHPVPPYSEDDEREAYLHPALTYQPPVIWLARDPLGVSRKEIEELRDSVGRYGVEATDNGAVVEGKKAKVEWVDTSVRTAPLWEGRVVY